MQQQTLGKEPFAGNEATQDRMEPKMGEIKIRSLAQAIRVFESKMFGKVKIIQDVIFEGARIGRYYKNELTGEKILLVFKREFYYMFSRHFPDVPEKGYGVMNNVKLTHWAALQDAKIAAMFQDGRCYKIDAMEFYRYYEKHGTDVMAVYGEIASPLSKWEPVF